MIVWHGLERCPPGTQAALALGNFDGVHLGHQAVLRQVLASDNGADSILAELVELAAAQDWAPAS